MRVSAVCVCVYTGKKINLGFRLNCVEFELITFNYLSNPLKMTGKLMKDITSGRYVHCAVIIHAVFLLSLFPNTYMDLKFIIMDGIFIMYIIPLFTPFFRTCFRSV